jgi:AraC-like DNA-binding protein
MKAQKSNELNELAKEANEIVKIDTVQKYNDLFGLETLNPLVTVVDFSTMPPITGVRAAYSLYCVFLKEVKCGDMTYGRQKYDYQEGTVVTTAPGQVYGFVTKEKHIVPKGWGLIFHPDLIRGTSLGQNILNYHFFSYEVNEALHLSEKERAIVIDCMKKIQGELNHDIDKHSKKLIVRNIELLLDYCDRFYDRQFITRENVNKDVLTRFESLLTQYYTSGKAENEGVPSVAQCAEKLNLSSNYFGDLIKKETGISAQEHIQKFVIEQAKEKLMDGTKSVSEVAYELGFKYPQHFTRLFKQHVGSTPNDYRSMN